MSEVGRRKVVVVAVDNSAGKVQNNGVPRETSEEVPGTLEGDRFEGEAISEGHGLISTLDITNSNNTAIYQLNFTDPTAQLPARVWRRAREIFRQFIPSRSFFTLELLTLLESRLIHSRLVGDTGERSRTVDGNRESNEWGGQNNGVITARPSRGPIHIVSRDNSASGSQNNGVFENDFGGTQSDDSSIRGRQSSPGRGKSPTRRASRTRRGSRARGTSRRRQVT